LLRKAIRQGNDTDTTACIAGGLAGLLYGCDAIPARWLDMLRGKELVEKLLARS
jgi:ADP-ribosylglycohydrolase